VKNSVKKYRADILLIAGILLVGAVIALVLLLGQKAGSRVEVRLSGEVVRSFSLDDAVTYEIVDPEGGRNILRIEGGKAWIEEADCPDRLCVGMGKISRIGQTVVCLPHELVIEIVGEKSPTDDVDVIAG
jgi:hypothetical protein